MSCQRYKFKFLPRHQTWFQHFAYTRRQRREIELFPILVAKAPWALGNFISLLALCTTYVGARYDEYSLLSIRFDGPWLSLVCRMDHPWAVSFFTVPVPARPAEKKFRYVVRDRIGSRKVDGGSRRPTSKKAVWMGRWWFRSPGHSGAIIPFPSHTSCPTCRFWCHTPKKESNQI